MPAMSFGLACLCRTRGVCTVIEVLSSSVIEVLSSSVIEALSSSVIEVLSSLVIEVLSWCYWSIIFASYWGVIFTSYWSVLSVIEVLPSPVIGLLPWQLLKCYHRSVVFTNYWSVILTVKEVLSSHCLVLCQVSVIARQQGNRLEKFQTEAGDHLEMLHIGLISAKVRVLCVHLEFLFFCVVLLFTVGSFLWHKLMTDSSWKCLNVLEFWKPLTGPQQSLQISEN